MRFTLDYKIDKSLSEEEKATKEQQAYVSYCVEFVTSLQDKLNIVKGNHEIDELDEKGQKTNNKINVVRYSMDLPFIRVKNKCRRKNLKFNKNEGIPYLGEPVEDSEVKIPKNVNKKEGEQ